MMGLDEAGKSKNTRQVQGPDQAHIQANNIQQGKSKILKPGNEAGVRTRITYTETNGLANHRQTLSVMLCTGHIKTQRLKRQTN